MDIIGTKYKIIKFAIDNHNSKLEYKDIYNFCTNPNEVIIYNDGFVNTEFETEKYGYNSNILKQLSSCKLITKDIVDYYNLDSKERKQVYNDNFINSIDDINEIKRLQYYQYTIKFDFKALSKAKNFNIDWVEHYLNEEWDFKRMAETPNFDIKWVKQYPNKNWDFKIISQSPNFKMEWIKEFPDKDWDYEFINNRDKLVINFSSASKQVNYFTISKKLLKEDLNIVDIKNTINNYIFCNRSYLVFNFLSKNPNFKFEWIKELPKDNWDYEYIFKNY